VAGQQQFAHWFTELIGLYYIGSGAGRQFLVVARAEPVAEGGVGNGGAHGGGNLC
jgi:hypothetical protein